jgi:GR25 family glycosyltransferase involved in LPS biosynthesis
MLDVGIITSKREPSTIGQTLDSYFENFTHKPFVFAEPDTLNYRNQSKVFEHRNTDTLGCFYNWLSMIEKMYLWTQNEYIMLLEDDVIFQDNAGNNIRDFLKKHDTSPLKSTVISPYCSLSNRPEKQGWQISYFGKIGFCGSLCLIMSRKTLGYFVSKKDVLIETSHGIHLDTAIGVVAGQIITHNPTLVQHIGLTSTWARNNGQELYCRKPAL